MAFSGLAFVNLFILMYVDFHQRFLWDCVWWGGGKKGEGGGEEGGEEGRRGRRGKEGGEEGRRGLVVFL